MLLIFVGVFLAVIEWPLIPAFLQRRPQSFWLCVAAAGWLGIAWLAVRGRPWRSACKYGLVWFLVGGALIAVFPLMSAKVGAQQLLNHHSLFPWKPYEPPPRLVKLQEVMVTYHIPGSAGFGEWLRREPERDTSCLWDRVESKRWLTRKTFVGLMLEDHPDQLFLKWGDMFPAVVGVDVDLRHRRELIEMLDAVRTSGASSKNAKSSATLWMALVFLTDPPEFMGWRPKIRDAVFAAADPPYDMTGDCWMRVADCLLTFEDPADWKSITANFASDRILLRRATRERVRGMANHHAAIVREASDVAARRDAKSAMALWLDVGRFVVAHPQVPGSNELGDWWSRTLMGWLAADHPAKELDEYDAFHDPQSFGPDERFPAISKPLQEQVAQVILGWVDHALRSDGLNEEEREALILRIQSMLPLLDKEGHEALAAGIIPVLLRSPGYLVSTHSKQRPYDLNRMGLGMAFHFLNQMDAGQQARHRMCLRDAWRNTASPGILLWRDAWSVQPAFSEEERLVASWVICVGSYKPPFRIARDDKMPSKSIGWQPRPVPEIDRDLARRLADRIATAWSEGESASSDPRDRLAIAIRRALGHSNEAFLTPDLERRFVMRFFGSLSRDWVSGMTEDDLRKLIMLQFHATGMVVPTEEDRADVASLFDRHDSMLDAYLAAAVAFPELFGALYADSESACRRLKHCIEHRDDRFIRQLLSTCERLPPKPEVFSSMWDQLMEMTGPDHAMRDRLRAYAAMIRLAPQASEQRRRAMREDFRRFFDRTRPSTMQWPRTELGDAYDYRPRGIGEGISWDDDPLAAEWAWSSEIKLEAEIDPDWGMAVKGTGVFSYLAQACSYAEDDGPGGMFIRRPSVDEPVSAYLWRRAPLTRSFEMTPWQRARQLHLRRPDLRFVDPIPYREVGKRE